MKADSDLVSANLKTLAAQITTTAADQTENTDSVFRTLSGMDQILSEAKLRPSNMRLEHARRIDILNAEADALEAQLIYLQTRPTACNEINKLGELYLAKKEFALAKRLLRRNLTEHSAKMYEPCNRQSNFLLEDIASASNAH